MSNQLDINVLKYYLGTGVDFIHYDDERICTSRLISAGHKPNGEVTINNYKLSAYDRLKLCLRPMSDIQKVIFHDNIGSFTPLRYLYFEIIGTDNDIYGTYDEFIDYFNETPVEHLSCIIRDFLVSVHFNVFNLDPSLWVDINTIE